MSQVSCTEPTHFFFSQAAEERTAGTTRREAIDCAHRAIIEHLMQQRWQKHKSRRQAEQQHQASASWPHQSMRG